jgi:hypothetical protein
VVTIKYLYYGNHEHNLTDNFGIDESTPRCTCGRKMRKTYEEYEINGSVVHIPIWVCDYCR